MGICNQLKDTTDGSPFKTTIDWLFLITAIIPPAFEPLGILPILNILLAELFPTDIRNISVGIVMSLTYTAAYGNMMAYPMISSANAFRELMFGYGAIAAFMTVWAIITMEETDNMSLVEIEKLFSRVRNSSRRDHNSNETRANKDSRLKLTELLECAPLLKD